MTMRKFKIGLHERGFLFEEGEFKCVLEPGRHWFFDLFGRIKVEIASVRETVFTHKDLEVISRTGALKGLAEVVELKNNERALVWVDGRFERLLKPGFHAVWTIFRKVRVEVLSVDALRFEHAELRQIYLAGALGGLAEVADVKDNERALLWVDGRLEDVLKPGLHAFWSVFRKVRIEVISTEAVHFEHAQLQAILRGKGAGLEVQVLDLKDDERALVWSDGRFEAVLKPGVHALWNVFHAVRVEVVKSGTVRFEHAELPAILQGKGVAETLELFCVEQGHTGLFFNDGAYVCELKPGTHAFWRGVKRVRVHAIDAREQALDIAGQEIMTADKVTLRLNAVVSFRVADALKAVTDVEDFKQALYREAQLALRAVIGAKDLDALLAEKDAVAKELEGLVKNRAAALGVEVLALGIRDVILPGEMKDLLNKVTEARKASEAALITRREETAAMRMQANTAKILETSPILMRLRELEAMERIAGKGNLQVMLGEKGLVDRVVKML